MKLQYDTIQEKTKGNKLSYSNLFLSFLNQFNTLKGYKACGLCNKHINIRCKKQVINIPCTYKTCKK